MVETDFENQMIPKQLFCYLLINALLVLFGCSSPNREIQPSQSNQSEQRAIRPVVQTTSSDYRQALVIGNSDYDYAGVLRNPTNDEQAISNTLGELGFEVSTVIDADKRGMEQAIRSFGKQLRDRRSGDSGEKKCNKAALPKNLSTSNSGSVEVVGVKLSIFYSNFINTGKNLHTGSSLKYFSNMGPRKLVSCLHCKYLSYSSLEFQ